LFVFLLKDFEKDRVDSVLNTIFNTNVMTFGGGKIGAVNGMTRSGQLEIVSMQSEEIWTGVTYGLSSTMIMEVRFSSMYRMCALIFAL
jgi:non-lysosomal glucosylceramidase